LILLPIGKVYSGIAGKTHRGITGKLFRNTGKACSEFLVKYEIGIVVNYRVEYAMYIKKLEQGTFEWPKGKDISITSQQLTLLLQGVMLDSVRLRKRYQRVN
jgi:hypothetical protein